MNDNLNPAQRLRDICALLLEYEKVTLPLLTCPVDDISGYIEARTVLMEKISAQNALLEAQCNAEPSGLLKAAASCSCDRSTLSEELKTVFDAKLEVNAIIVRLISAEKQASERIADERDRLAAKIKDMNQSHNAQAAKYYEASRYNSDEYFFRPESKKI